MRKRQGPALLFVHLIFLVGSACWSQTSLEATSLNGGGGAVQGGSYALQTTLAQSGVIGISGGSPGPQYEIAWGFQQAAAPINTSPTQPTNVSPANGAVGVSVAPTLQSSAFDDPDPIPPEYHAASRWQVSTANNFSAAPPIVWDSGRTTTALTTANVPGGVLTVNTGYFWRVRHQDSAGSWSLWSAATYFQTAAQVNATIAGRVTDAATSAGIANALVQAFYGGPSAAQTYTSAQGYYGLQVMGNRTCTVTATAAGYDGDQKTQYVAAGTTATVNFDLTPQNGTIAGRVVRAGINTGISSATVTLSGGPSVVTNAQGYYTIANVTPGYDKTVTASATGCVSQQISGIVVYAGQTTVVYFSLIRTQSATVQGYVRSQAERPISDARVTITPGGYQIFSNSAGFYSLAVTSGTGYSIRAEAAGYYGSGEQPLPTLVAGNTYTHNFNLTREYEAPAPPTGLTATAGDERVDLSWNPNGELDLSGYNLFRADQGTSPINTALITGTHYQDLGLTNGTTYTYWLRAVDRDGLVSNPSASVQATPYDASPDPVSGLRATLLPFGIVVLHWAPSPSADAALYHVYSDNASGAIDYNTDVAGSPVTSPTLIWVSQPLTIGTPYKFGVRVEDTQGNIERNTTVVIRVTPINQFSGSAKVYIASPHPGKRLRGNQVCVFARPLPGFEAGLEKVRFEVFYNGNWRYMQTHNARHSNPDDQEPYFLLWNVSSLPDGVYDIRAVGIDVNGNADANPMSIRVVVDGQGGEARPASASLNDQIVEDGSSSPTAQIDIEELLTAETLNQHHARVRAYRNVANSVFVGNDAKDQLTTLTVPAGALERDTKLRVTLLDANRFRAAHSLKVQQGQTSDRIDCAIDEFTEVALESGQTNFAVPVQMTVPYSDFNNDGWIDGYAIREEQLAPVLIDSKGNLTDLSYTSDSLKNHIVVQLPKTGTVGLIVKLVEANVAIASAVPTPEPRWFHTGLFLSGGGQGEGALRPGSHTPQVLPGASATTSSYRWAEIRSLGGNMTWYGQAGHPYDPPVITGPPGTGLPASADFFAPGLSQFGLYFRVGDIGTTSTLARPGAVLSGEGEIYITVNTFKSGSLGQIGSYQYQLVLHTQSPLPTRASPAWLRY